MHISFEMQKIPEKGFPAHVFHVRDYLSEGQEQRCIQNAVEACTKAGGGTVIVDDGEWVSGPIHLHSNIHLMLEEGAVVRFLEEYEAYLPVVFTRWEGIECYNYSPLIYARDCGNIAITGKGKLEGGGRAWWHWKKLQQKAADELCYAESSHIPVESRIYGTSEAALRPSFIQFIDCEDIRLEDFTVEDGPQWTLHPVYCNRVLVRNVTVHTTGPNTDGLNPDSCSNVWIEGCSFTTGDDCIALNAGMNEDGWRVGRPCENIVIWNCEMRGGHGALTIGSGISGGVHNVHVADCKVWGTNQGIRLKSMRGRGGYIKDVWFENIELHDILEEAIQVSMFYPYSTVVPKTEVPSVFSGIHFRNISGDSAKLAVEMRGLPESRLENITLEDIHLKSEQLFVCDQVDKIYLKAVELENRVK